MNASTVCNPPAHRLLTEMRALFLLLLSAATLLGCGGESNNSPSNPHGAVAPLAADRLVFDSDRAGGTHEIYTMKTDGSGVTRLTNDERWQNWWPRISPDRKKVLFYRAPADKPESYADASLWLMNADGSSVTRLRAQGEDGWRLQGHAEWSPDGTRIAMFGSAGAALEIFVTDADGKNPVQYTNRDGVNTDVSWSPDGTRLLFNGCPSAAACAPADYEIYAMDASPLAAATRITNDNLADYDAYFSPDGSKVAWLVNVDPRANPLPASNVSLGRWAIRIATIGSPASYLIDDGNINSKPAWSLDSQTIYFHRMVPPDYRFRVFSIRPDGSGLTELTPGNTGNSEHPAN
jgi:Tol biopolymer transport system component